MADTRAKILEVATRLTQTVGFDGFSYADVSDAVGIRKASVHHHFPAKADLGAAMVDAYRQAFAEHLQRIDAKAPRSAGRLERYAALYGESLRDDRLCLCGALAAAGASLPEKVRLQVAAFFGEHVGWLARTLDDGRRAGELAFAGKAPERARALLASLQGALLVARGLADEALFETTTRALLSELSADRRSAGSTPGR
jgi:TetR/AcrR family transcriptional repressor of nem operon